MKRNKRPILITGAAGFIGAALALELLKRGENVIGIDNLNDYYDISLKLSRINRIENVKTIGSWKFIKASIDNSQDLANIFEKENPRIVVHLAAQAGVRYSLSHPDKYVASNLVGFANILDQCKKIDLEHFVFASSSSVYGGNQRVPYSEKDSVNHPISFYAATKRSNELMAHSYSHLFNIPTTGLRFFTVYGPWGRPDMAPMIFAKSILKNKSIDVFNNGDMFRDFTYIDDVVEATIRCCYKPAESSLQFDPKNPDPNISKAPYRIFNVGNQSNINLLKFINLLEKSIGAKAVIEFKELQPGDVINTYSDTSLLKNWIDFVPNYPISKGVEKFVNWYKNFYNL